MGNNVFEMFSVYLYKKRWLLAVNFIVIFAAVCVYAFVIAKKEYSASVTFLPPAGDNFSSGSLLSLATASSSLLLGGASPDQIEVVFDSKATKRRIIDEFNMIEYFKLEKSENKFELAAKGLKKYVIFGARDEGGFGMTKTLSYTITCFHSSPDTVKLMADFTFALLDSAVKEISIDKAQRNRIFIESQLATQNIKLDSLQGVFQNFQNENKAYNVPEQASLSLKAYADLKSISLMNELKLASLQSEFSGSTHEIAELKRERSVYNSKLREFEIAETPDILPSLDRSSKLFPQYVRILRSIEVQNQLILFLTRELEQARLQESKDISPLIIVDPSYVPDYKARPKRITVVIVLLFAEHLFLLGFLAYLFYVKHVLMKNDKFNAFIKTVKQG